MRCLALEASMAEGRMATNKSLHFRGTKPRPAEKCFAFISWRPGKYGTVVIVTVAAAERLCLPWHQM